MLQSFKVWRHEGVESWKTWEAGIGGIPRGEELLPAPRAGKPGTDGNLFSFLSVSLGKTSRSLWSDSGGDSCLEKKIVLKPVEPASERDTPF